MTGFRLANLNAFWPRDAFRDAFYMSLNERPIFQGGLLKLFYVYINALSARGNQRMLDAALCHVGNPVKLDHLLIL